LDILGNMCIIVKKSFPNATLVIDRFHVQKLALDVLQEIRIKHRWEALDNENDAIDYARNHSLKYSPKLLQNEDMLKQLLAKSKYLLYKSSSKWTENRSKRAVTLFEKYPELEKTYRLCQNLSRIFNNTKDKTSALVRLTKGDEKVRQTEFNSFNTNAHTM
jgi:transposase